MDSQNVWPLDQPIYYAFICVGFIGGMVIAAFMRRRLSRQGFSFWVLLIGGGLAFAILAIMFLIPRG